MKFYLTIILVNTVCGKRVPVGLSGTLKRPVPI